MDSGETDNAPPKMAWRGNRKSTYAQEFHAREREMSTRFALTNVISSTQYKVTGSDKDEKKNAAIYNAIGSQKQRKSGILELKTLEELKKIFDFANGTTHGKLNKEEFMNSCSNIDEVAMEMSENEVEQFFMKIDVNNNGVISWTDFTNYMLLLQLANDDSEIADPTTYVRVKTPGHKIFDESDEDTDSDKEDQVIPFGAIMKHHKIKKGTVLRPSNIIERMLYLRSIQTYVTATQDGYLQLWNSDTLKLLRTQKNGNGAWITDIVAMAQQPLTVFAMDRSITFYDTGRLSLDILGRIECLRSSPMCATWLRTEECDKLLYGDDEGVLHTLTFIDEWGGDDTKVSPGVFGYLLPGISEESPWPIHSTWVTKLKYLGHSSSLISSCMDGNLMMLDLEKQKKKWSTKEHQNGIFSFDYCRSFNFIVTCGLERHINVVNPFTAKLIGALHGHRGPIMDVVVNEKDHQIMSVASDNVIKVWDMRTYRCLQTICEKLDEKSIDPPVLCRLLYDRRRSTLLVGGSSMHAFHQKGAHETKISKICAAIYNSIFNQVVIGRVDFLITIWNLDDGSKVLSFSDEHRGTKISSMCFDSSGRRLLVAGQDGSLRMWNYNNGQCLKEFMDFGQEEIACISCLEEGKVKFTAAGGWNGKVCIWSDGERDHESLKHIAHGHSDDVACMIVFPPNCFATGGYDGKILIWKVDGVIRCVFEQPEQEFTKNGLGAIVSLLYLPYLEKVLVGMNIKGDIYFWRIPDIKPVASILTNHIGQPGPICTNLKNSMIFTSDAKGYVKAWELKEGQFTKETSTRCNFLELFCFRAHCEPIVAMCSVNEKNLFFTAAVSGTCRLWTETGTRVGQFGQLTPWDLSVPETWSDRRTSYLTDSPRKDNDNDNDSLASTECNSRVNSSRGTSRTCPTTSTSTCGATPLPEIPTEVGTLEVGNHSGPEHYQSEKHEKVSHRDGASSSTLECSLQEKLVSVLENGPPHLRLESWFAPLQASYERRLHIKEDVTPRFPTPPHLLEKQPQTCIQSEMEIATPSSHISKSSRFFQ